MHLGPRKLAGVVVEVVAVSDVAPEKLQTIDAVAATPSVPDDVLDMASFVASYYQSRWAWRPRLQCRRWRLVVARAAHHPAHPRLSRKPRV